MRKLKAENINNILFLDIETAPNWEHLKDAPENAWVRLISNDATIDLPDNIIDVAA